MRDMRRYLADSMDAGFAGESSPRPGLSRRPDKEPLALVDEVDGADESSPGPGGDAGEGSLKEMSSNDIHQAFQASHTPPSLTLSPDLQAAPPPPIPKLTSASFLPLHLALSSSTLPPQPPPLTTKTPSAFLTAPSCPSSALPGCDLRRPPLPPSVLPASPTLASLPFACSSLLSSRLTTLFLAVFHSVSLSLHQPSPLTSQQLTPLLHVFPPKSPTSCFPLTPP
ncbi:uncharacterized protein A4U43_C08F24390 [Asparagus officinalis]|nr:uncharacterized protein A4U43_C08F24390 [Asparagus officinalis]